MINDLNNKEFCAVCGGTFKGARSHKDKPYKTCKNCLDKENINNRSSDVINRIDKIPNDNQDNNNLENIEQFEELKKYIDVCLDIDSVYEVKSLKKYYQAVFYNVPEELELNKKIIKTNNDFIITGDKYNNLRVSLRKE